MTGEEQLMAVAAPTRAAGRSTPSPRDVAVRRARRAQHCYLQQLGGGAMVASLLIIILFCNGHGVLSSLILLLHKLDLDLIEGMVSEF